MELRRKINWETKRNLISNSKHFDLLKFLEEQIGNKSVTYIDLLNKLIQIGHKKYSNAWWDLFEHKEEYFMPPNIYYATRQKHKVSLRESLDKLNLLCYSHSAYAALVLRICLSVHDVSMTKITQAKISDYDINNSVIFENYTLPEWAKIVIDRQIKICHSLKMEDDDPLFFVMRYTDVTKIAIRSRHLLLDDPEITDVLYLFRINYGYSFASYVKEYAMYCGLKQSAIVISVDGLKIERKYMGVSAYKAIRHKKYFKLYNIITYTYNTKSKFINRKVIDMAYVLHMGEPGLYLVHGTLGIYKVPWYMLRMPIVRAGREKDHAIKNKLHMLGYYNKEFYDNIKSFKQLADHKITPKKLKRNNK